MMPLTEGGKVSLRSLAKKNGKPPAKEDTYTYLLIAADAVTRLQDTRKALDNQARALEQDKDLGGTTRHLQWVSLAKEIERNEKLAKKLLELEVRKLPFNDWIDANPGVGYVSIGRLLGEIGNPADRETPSQLVAYCGYHVVGGKRPRRKDGVNWNVKAKSKVYVVATRCKLAGDGPYEALYREAKAKAANKTHTYQCQNTVKPSLTGPKGSNGCGTKAHPEWGEPGSLWRPGHQEQHAISVVARRILIDLWEIATQAA